ncbi:hypothetical protein [Cesiribacter andamanensis]|uniref:hypothetical protein n=1 Tax=Cesiribacter andamanensis TaxID=649507 RepID=UPI00058F1A10|nr:hypothetical protein [Cesiribacter andamanensis]
MLHLKHSRQLLEDFLYQYLPLLTGMGAVSRLNLWGWFSGTWALRPDASGGLPYMVLEALRLQRQFLLQQKRPLKPLSLSLYAPQQDRLLLRALPQLEELNRRNPTATLAASTATWQEVLKQLQAQLLRQPAAERNLLLLDPLEISLPPLPELLQLLPKRMDVLLLLPLAAVQDTAGLPGRQPLPEAVAALARWLAPHLPAPLAEAQEAPGPALLLEQLRQKLMDTCGHFALLQQPEANSLALFGLSQDALMMEKMLQARQKLQQREVQQMETGDQLGLFAAPPSPAAPANLQDRLLALLARQPEWSNQELYKALLQQELLPQDVLAPLAALVNAGILQVLNEKKKKIKEPITLPLSHTAFKLPAPACFFRLKDQPGHP